MNFDELKLFVHLASHRSVTKTSAFLNVSQSSISHRLQALRKKLGVKLYYRTPVGIELTKDGRKFAAGSKVILRQFEDLKYELSNGRRGNRPQTLTVAGGHGASESLLSGFLAHYRKNHPLAKTSLRSGNRRAVERMVLRSEAEIGFVTLHPASSRLVAEPFSAEDVVPFVSVIHPLAKKSKVTLKELARAPLLIRRGTGSEEDVERLLQKLLELKPNIVARCESSQAVRSGVEIGTSVGLLTRPHIASGIEDGSLKFLHIPGFAMQIGRFIIYRKDGELSATARDFLALLRAAKPFPKTQLATNPHHLDQPGKIRERLKTAMKLSRMIYLPPVVYPLVEVFS